MGKAALKDLARDQAASKALGDLEEKEAAAVSATYSVWESPTCKYTEQIKRSKLGSSM